MMVDKVEQVQGHILLAQAVEAVLVLSVKQEQQEEQDLVGMVEMDYKTIYQELLSITQAVVAVVLMKMPMHVLV